MNIYNLPTTKVPEHLQEIIKSIQEILGDEAYDFLLIGAIARDLILDGQYGLGVSRKTLDVDFAIYVPQWENYDSIIKRLTDSKVFTSTKVKHRLIYKENSEVDIVPFGEIQDEKGEYTWPPEDLHSMNVAGFMEINEKGITIEVEKQNLKFRVAPIHGIAFMKIFAWKDRKHRNNKDGKDLGFIISNYVELKYEILYKKYEDIIDAQDFDVTISGARILGRDIKELIGANLIALQTLKEILEKEIVDEDNSHLARAIVEGGVRNYDIGYLALISLLKGLNDE